MFKLFKIIRRIIFSILLIYGYNIFSQSLNLVIPFNILTITYVSFFGIPGFVSLITILVFGFK